MAAEGPVADVNANGWLTRVRKFPTRSTLTASAPASAKPGRQRPTDACREALDRTIKAITLSTGGAHIDYRVKHGQIGLHQPPVRPA